MSKTSYGCFRKKKLELTNGKRPRRQSVNSDGTMVVHQRGRKSSLYYSFSTCVKYVVKKDLVLQTSSPDTPSTIVEERRTQEESNVQPSTENATPISSSVDRKVVNDKNITPNKKDTVEKTLNGITPSNVDTVETSMKNDSSTPKDSTIDTTDTIPDIPSDITDWIFNETEDKSLSSTISVEEKIQDQQHKIIPKPSEAASESAIIDDRKEIVENDKKSPEEEYPENEILDKTNPIQYQSTTEPEGEILLDSGRLESKSKRFPTDLITSASINDNELAKQYLQYHYLIDKYPTIEERNLNRPPLLGEQLERDKYKKTLVLDLDETLVHSTFKESPVTAFSFPVYIENFGYLVYVNVRPGVSEFLQKLAPYWELVIFTASLEKYASPLIDTIDPQGLIGWRLYRDSCLHWNNKYVKDLERLGRNLEDIIIIDNSPLAFCLQPFNAIPIQGWYDDMQDTELLQLLSILLYFAKADNIPLLIKELTTSEFQPQEEYTS